jgi:hypothetical protein
LTSRESIVWHLKLDINKGERERTKGVSVRTWDEDVYTWKGFRLSLQVDWIDANGVTSVTSRIGSLGFHDAQNGYKNISFA